MDDLVTFEDRARAPLGIGITRAAVVAGMDLARVPPIRSGYAEQLADARRVRNVDIGVGAALLVVGGGLVVDGGVLLARSRKGKGTRASLVPRVRRDGVGLSARVSL